MLNEQVNVAGLKRGRRDGITTANRSGDYGKLVFVLIVLS